MTPRGGTGGPVAVSLTLPSRGRQRLMTPAADTADPFRPPTT